MLLIVMCYIKYIKNMFSFIRFTRYDLGYVYCKQRLGDEEKRVRLYLNDAPDLPDQHAAHMPGNHINDL